MNDKNGHQSMAPDRPVKWRHWIVLCGFSAFAALLLLQEHRAHLWGLFLYLILLMCPFMLLVMFREQKSLEQQIDGKRPEDNTEDKS